MTWMPSLWRASSSGSAAQARNVTTSCAICATEALVPSAATKDVAEYVVDEPTVRLMTDLGVDLREEAGPWRRELRIGEAGNRNSRRCRFRRRDERDRLRIEQFEHVVATHHAAPPCRNPPGKLERRGNNRHGYPA